MFALDYHGYKVCVARETPVKWPVKFTCFLSSAGVDMAQVAADTKQLLIDGIAELAASDFLTIEARGATAHDGRSVIVIVLRLNDEDKRDTINTYVDDGNLVVDVGGSDCNAIQKKRRQKKVDRFHALGSSITLLDTWVEGLQPASGCQILLNYGYAGQSAVDTAVADAATSDGSSSTVMSGLAPASGPTATTLTYFTILREPIARAVSEYNYFCLDCKDDAKFCKEVVYGGLHLIWRGRHNMCPHITFLEWVRRRSNQYTRQFEHYWGVNPPEPYFAQYLRGWNVSTTDQQYKRALSNLKRPNMHVMWLETLDHGGWKRFEDYLTASGVVPWINTARRTSGGVCANSSLSACAAKKTVHENANGRRRRSTQISHHYAPTDAELSEAARINHHDVALHAALTTP